jgi:hypothetical protein
VFKKIGMQFKSSRGMIVHNSNKFVGKDMPLPLDLIFGKAYYKKYSKKPPRPISATM